MEYATLVHDGRLTKSPNHVRFVCISDTHSQTESLSVPDGDVLIHSGDFCKSGDSYEVAQFNRFLRNLPHPYKVVVAGNHDYPFDVKNYSKILSFKRKVVSSDPFQVKAQLRNCIYLEDSGVKIHGYKIWGSPWTIQHYLGAFTIKSPDLLAEKWAGLPDDIDILITHSPPLGHCDLTGGRVHVGSESLKERVVQINPVLHAFGHIHEGHGYERSGSTLFVNSAICNNKYKPVFKPIVVDLPRKAE